MIGKTILNYTIIKQLDAGGMGSVFLAKHDLLGHHVVVKILLDKHLLNADVVKRFVQEARILTRLTHPNIVRLVNFTEDPVYGYMIFMDYVVGKTLEAYRNTFPKQQLPLDVTLKMMSELLDAFAYAHAQGVVHRDIKPNNIFITPEGKPIVLDFGISKLKNSGLTGDSRVMGTPLYMSPEQINAPHEVDLRSDIYTLGVVLYELLTGKSPYNDIFSLYALMKEIAETPMPKVTSIRTDLPTKLDTVLAKATAKDKADRYENVTLFKQDLMKVGEKEADTPTESTTSSTPIAPTTVKEGWGGCLMIGCFIGCVIAALYYKEIGHYFEQRERKQLHAEVQSAATFFKSGQYDKAFPLYEKNKDKYQENSDKIDAYLALGYMRFRGNHKEVADSYFKVVENNMNGAELRKLGEVFKNGGYNFPKDDNMKIYWYQKAAAKGDSCAPLLLGNVYLYGEGVPINKTEAFKWYEIVARNADDYHLHKIGHSFEIGDSSLYYEGGLLKVPKDANMKIYWYEKAAAKGYTLALFELGNAYFHGEDIPINKTEAFKWYQKAAPYYTEAQYMLGLMYYEGMGIAKDYNMAAYWYRKAADQGNADAQNNLGDKYEKGHGIPLDLAKAFEWYERAALQGNSYGEFNLGVMYELGKSVTKDDQKAVEWYQKSAKHDNPLGQVNLAKMYEAGKGGLPKDVYQAVVLYQSAAKQGNAVAKSRLKQLGYNEL